MWYCNKESTSYFSSKKWVYSISTKNSNLGSATTRRLLRVPWTARRSNQSILKEINPGCSLKGLMIKLKLQYFGHLMQRVDSLERTLMLGGTGGRRRRDDRGWDVWMASPTRWRESEWTLGVGDGQGGLACCDSWGRKESDTTEQLNWTDPRMNLGTHSNKILKLFSYFYVY